MTPSVHENASHVVKDLLKLDTFIDAHWENIETRLEAAESRADKPLHELSAQDASVEFFAECLPYAAAIVHAGSASDHFVAAKTWAEEQHERVADAVSILALLTFVYLVDYGVAKSLEKTPPDTAKQEKWGKIRSRLNGLLGQPATAAA